MSKPMSKDTDQEKTLPGTPSPELRTFLSFLLFVHLFILLVAVGAHFGAVSGLRGAIRENAKFSYYLDLLQMDLGYDFHLTHNLRDDFDHSCDLILNTPQGFQGTPEEMEQIQTLPLMPQDCWPGARRQRFLTLARQVALRSEDESSASILPHSIASGLLAREGISEGTHRFRSRVLTPISLEAYRTNQEGTENPLDDAFYENVYQADVVSIGKGEWNLAKVSSRLESTQRSGTSANTTPTNTEEGGR